MDKHKRWSRYFDNHKYPCFISVESTGELLFCNESFLSLYDVKMDWLGKCFDEIISMSTIQSKLEFPDKLLQDVFETETYNKQLNKRFLVKSTKIFDDDTIFSEIIPLDESINENCSFEQAMTRCVEVFQNNDTSNPPIDFFTELLAEFYDAEIAYVYRFHKDISSIEMLTKWLSPDFVPTESGTSKIGKERMLEWFCDPKTPVVSLGAITDDVIDEFLFDIMSTFMVKNILISKIEDNHGEIVGFIGVSNRRDITRYVDLRLLSTIAKFVAQDVAKEIVDTNLFEIHYQDSLTGMFNREGYAQKIDKITNSPPKTLGVISINVNGLKIINESMGIAEGDLYIKNSTDLLTSHFDFKFFRLSGDEFVGIAPDVELVHFENQVFALHEKMQSDDNQNFAMGHSWASHNFDFHKLLQDAEVIMYINKQDYYSNTKRTIDTIKDNVLSDLLSFLANDEFMIYLQPQVKLKDSALYGAEALIRRFDKTNKKMVFPDQFIPLYEQKSIIRHVDMFVVESVCKLLQEWDKFGKSIPISVNLSRVTLQEYGVIENIVDICDRYNVPHNLLVIEVTERVGLVENNVASSLITAFKNHGFNISLDDFGCAYSNIVTLAQIEVDEVKIDKSLVDDLTTNQKNHILVKNVLSMCNELECASTLAEGIEDEHQAKLLLDLGCHLGQGYFYSRPIPVDEFIEKYINSSLDRNEA